MLLIIILLIILLIIDLLGFLGITSIVFLLLNPAILLILIGLYLLTRKRGK